MLIILGISYTRKGRVTSPGHKWIALGSAAVLSFTSGRHWFPPGCTLELPGKLWKMPGSRSYPGRRRSHFSGHLGNSNVQSGLRSTKAELSFKCTKSRADNSKSPTSPFPFSSFSPSHSLSGHFPGGGCKMCPLISKARETEDVAPCLRKKSEQNRSYFIYHKGEWEIYKTELSKNIIRPFNFICLEGVLPNMRFWNAVLSSRCWIWGSGITFRLFSQNMNQKERCA